MPRIKEGFKGERAIVLPAFLIEELKQDPLGSELYITDIGYYPHACFHYRKRNTEEATEFILIYCMEGEGNDIQLLHQIVDLRADQIPPLLAGGQVAFRFGQILFDGLLLLLQLPELILQLRLLGRRGGHGRSAQSHHHRRHQQRFYPQPQPLVSHIRILPSCLRYLFMEMALPHTPTSTPPTKNPMSSGTHTARKDTRLISTPKVRRCASHRYSR